MFSHRLRQHQRGNDKRPVRASFLSSSNHVHTLERQRKFDPSHKRRGSVLLDSDAIIPESSRVRQHSSALCLGWGREKVRPPRRIGPSPRPTRPAPSGAGMASSSDELQSQQQEDDISCPPRGPEWSTDRTVESTDEAHIHAGVWPPQELSEWRQGSVLDSMDQHASTDHSAGESLATYGSQDREDQPDSPEWMEQYNLLYRGGSTDDVYTLEDVNQFQYMELGVSVDSGQAWTNAASRYGTWSPHTGQGHETDFVDDIDFEPASGNQSSITRVEFGQSSRDGDDYRHPTTTLELGEAQYAEHELGKGKEMEGTAGRYRGR